MKNLFGKLLENWQQRGIITVPQQAAINEYLQTEPVNLYWLLRTALSLSILTLTGGVGVLIYKHIDTIGHDVLLIAIGLLTVLGFYYAFRHSAPFSWGETENETKFADVALLVACSLFLVLEGYGQWRYEWFGTRYGLATFIPAVIFLGCAYRFDHRGLLAMGLTALASWVGLTITPFGALTDNNFAQNRLLYTAIVFSTAGLGVSAWLAHRSLKAHFNFTYHLLLGNLLLISLAMGVFIHQYWYVFAILLVGAVVYFFQYAQRTQTFIFLLMAVLYGYLGMTYVAFKLLPTDSLIILTPLYFVVSAVGVVWFFISYKKLLKPKNT